MTNRLKEDEKNERIIRGLLKLPENRRCINCNSLGPQYVCTNFWTFVCTTCSGIHREFTHRVKSVSMAKFTSQEVNALQQGGNQRAKEIYFKEWDTHRSVPDSSHIERLRDFIKHVYVDRRYTGERNYDKPPRVGEKEDFYDNRRTDSYQGGSRSPPFEDTERRYSSQSSPGGSYDGRRGPGYEQESRQYGDYGGSPAVPEFVNDWRRDDKFGNGRRDEERRVSDGDKKLDGRSPERPKDIGSSSPPVVRPVKEILGENTVPLRISEPPKAGGRAVDVSTQRTASCSSLGFTNEKPVEVKLETAGSLIDFDSEPEPPAAAGVPQAQQPTATLSATQPLSLNNDNNWASFDTFSQTTVTQTRTVNPLESFLSELSISTPVPAHASGIPGQPVHVINNPPTVASASNSSTFPLGAAPGLAVNGGNSFVNIYGAGQGPRIQYEQPSLFPSTSNQATIQQFHPVSGPTSIQSWNSSPAQSMQGYLNSSTAQASQPVSKSANEVTSDIGLQPAVADVKLSGRKELPADLFAVTHSAFPATIPGWQMGPPGGMGLSMQYNTAMSMPTLQQSVKPTNPFDVSSEPSPVQAPTFPSMASLQSALPNVLPLSGLMRTSSHGSPSPTWMPQSSPNNPALPSQAPSYVSAMPPQAPSYASAMPPQAPSYASAMPPQAPSYASAMPPQAPSYASAMPPQSPSYASALPPRAFMGQQVLSNSPLSGQQGFGSIRAEEVAFGSFSGDQQFAGRFSALTSPSPFSSVGGNPFG